MAIRVNEHNAKNQYVVKKVLGKGRRQWKNSRLLAWWWVLFDALNRAKEV